MRIPDLELRDLLAERSVLKQPIQMPGRLRRERIAVGQFLEIRCDEAVYIECGCGRGPLDDPGLDLLTDPPTNTEHTQQQNSEAGQHKALGDAEALKEMVEPQRHPQTRPPRRMPSEPLTLVHSA